MPTAEKKKSAKELMREKIAMEESKLTDSEKQLRAEQRKRAARKRRKKIIKTCIIILVLIAVVAFLVWQYFSKNVAEAKKPQNVYVVGTKTITNILSGTGSLQPVKTYNVAATVQGDIIAAPIVEGAEVEKGDVLYRIDSSDQETSIKNAKNNLRTAQLSYDDVLDSYEDLYATSSWMGVVTKLDVEVGDTVTANQIIGHVRDNSTMILDVPFFDEDRIYVRVGEYAEVTVEGYNEKVYGYVSEVDGFTGASESGAVTRNVRIAVPNPGAISPVSTATAIVNGKMSVGAGTFSYNEDKDITAGVTGEIVSLGIYEGSNMWVGMEYIRVSAEDLDKQLERAEISLDNAKTSYDNALERLEDYEITAPISGTVVEANFNVGETIDTQSGNIVAVIYDMSEYTFEMSIDELDITSVRINQDVKITCDAREGSTYSGYISKISKQGVAQNGVTNYPVTVTVNDPLALEELLPGMNVDAEIVVETVENAVAIPVEAVGRGNLVTVIKAEDVEKYGVELKAPATPVMSAQNADGTRPQSVPTGEDAGAIPQGVPTGDGTMTRPQGMPTGDGTMTRPQGMPTPEETDTARPQGMPAPEAGALRPQGMPTPVGNNATAGGYGEISSEARTESVRVTLGVSDDEYVQVLSGLKAGDVIIVQITSSGNSFFGMMMPGGGMPGGGMPGGGMNARPAGGGMPGGR